MNQKDPYEIVLYEWNNHIIQTTTHFVEMESWKDLKSVIVECITQVVTIHAAMQQKLTPLITIETKQPSHAEEEGTSLLLIYILLCNNFK